LIVADSSVVVAGFATWHELHEAARVVLDAAPRLPAHAALESYSVLTRLPPPHRAPAGIVVAFLAERFPDPYLELPPERFPEFLGELETHEITGGAAYDGLIAAVCREAGGTLVTCDKRAISTYSRLQAAVEYLG